MKQCPDRGQLELLLNNGLVETARDELELHVEDCALCQQALETLTDATICGLEPGPDVLKFVAGAEPGRPIDPLRATAVATAAADKRVGRVIPTVAGYEIEGELGRGGMGVVYKARHVRLNRSCALKMILAGAHASSDEVTRFVTEAEAIARLEHTSIVQIRHIGDADGLPFLELEYVSGGSLDQQLDGTPWPALRAARLAEQVALAIAEAHRQGIVHRDLKPSNVLMAAAGTPKVGDFGLAKMLDSRAGLTQSESVMGSPSYMAPEQAQGQAKQAGPAVDVYAVGAILYELLTGRPPFHGTTALETLEQVKTTEPVPPSRLVPGLPRDIETICLRCLQKEPGKRYETAQALAADLRRFLDGRPILARGISGVERAWRWCRRNRFVAGMTAITAAAILTLAVGATVAALTFRGQRDQIKGADRKTKESLFESLVAQAQARRFSRRVGQRFDGLDAMERAAQIARELKLPPERLDTLRDEVIACLALPDLREIRQVFRRQQGVFVVAFDSAMTRYALRFHDGTVLVKNVDDNQEIARFRAQGDRDIFVFGFSPDGRYLATTQVPANAVTVWDVDRQTVAVNHQGGKSANFSPDGRHMTVGLDGGEVVLLDLATRRTSRLWSGPAAEYAVAFRWDGAQVAVFSGDSVDPICRILDAETGRVIRSISLPIAHCRTIAWSPDGTTLATACDDRKIYLWDADTGKRKATLEGSTNDVLNAAFDPSGTLLATNGWEHRVRLWDTVLGRPALSVRAGYSPTSSDFSRDGRIIATGEDGVTMDKVDPALEYRTFAHGRIPAKVYYGAAIRRDGRLLAVGTDQGVALWDMARGTALPGLPIGVAQHVLFEASGNLLTSGSLGVRRWPVRLDSAPGDFRIGPPSEPLLPTGFGEIAEDRTGRVVASAYGDHALVSTPDGTVRVGPLNDVRSVAVSPDGKWLTTGSYFKNGAQVWRIGNDVPVADLASVGFARVVFNPDGTKLMTSEYPCRLWSASAWRQEREIVGKGLCFSPDGRYLVVEDASKVLLLVETESGRTVARFQRPDSFAEAIATFSPDGSRLVATTNDGPATNVWDLRAIRKRLASMGLDWDAPPYADDDPAGSSVPPLPPLQFNLGPLAGEMPVDVFATSP
jgi:eukaryotic-like serine/threonine-protein kinase